jgi:hypothetical protein
VLCSFAAEIYYYSVAILYRENECVLRAFIIRTGDVVLLGWTLHAAEKTSGAEITRKVSLIEVPLSQCFENE